MINNTNPLISIVVITYNSSNFVFETLESAKAQSYNNIELIVSDDCSTDNTIEICKEWLTYNKDRFMRTKLLTVDHNSGIASNCNRGCKEAKGDWIKIIAGDDVLESYYCTEILKFIKQTPDALCIVTNVTKYNDIISESNIISKTDLKKYKLFFDDFSPENQFQCLLRYNVVYTAGVIINKTVYQDFGYYDEKYPFMEDCPFWLKITKGGIRLFLLDIYGAKYRINSQSIQRAKPKEFWSKFSLSRYYVTTDCLKYYPCFERLLRKFTSSTEYFFFKFFHNRRNFFIIVILFLITKFPNLIINSITKKYL